MALNAEEERQKFLHSIRLALEDVKEMLPASLKSDNGIVAMLFSAIMQGIEFFGKISERFGKPSIDLNQNFSSQELQEEGAKEFLDEIKTIHLPEETCAYLLAIWRADPEDKSLAWVALADCCLKVGNAGVHAAQTIIDQQLVVIKDKVTAEDSIEKQADPELAAEFEYEIFLIKQAELQQIQNNARLEEALLHDERNQNQEDYAEHESLLQQGQTDLKSILEVGRVVITRHYQIYKNNALGIQAVVQDNRAEDRPKQHEVLHEEFEKWNSTLPEAPRF